MLVSSPPRGSSGGALLCAASPPRPFLNFVSARSASSVGLSLLLPPPKRRRGIVYQATRAGRRGQFAGA